MHELEVAQAAETLRSAERVVAFTGAGVSAESGVPTFRGAGGLWEGQPVEELASPRGFFADPVKVWRFYEERRRNLAERETQPGAPALAGWQGFPAVHRRDTERRWAASGGRFTRRARAARLDLARALSRLRSRAWGAHGSAVAGAAGLPRVRGDGAPGGRVVRGVPHRDCHVGSVCGNRTVRGPGRVSTSAVVYPAAGL
jgi:hypothetical protein